MSKNLKARELVRHDGLKDVLTGLLALPAFMDSAFREIKSAQRNGSNVNLFLLSLLEINDANEQVLAVRPKREVGDRNEKELYDLAARVLSLTTSIAQILRSNDLMSRYTFADILILTTGSYEEVSQKLDTCVAELGATSVGIKLSILNQNEKLSIKDALPKLHADNRDSVSSGLQDSHSPQKLLMAAIFQLEHQLLENFGAARLSN